MYAYPSWDGALIRVEKTSDELLVIGFITPRTQIPTAQILSTGMWECGPYIVSVHVEGVQLSKCLKDPISNVNPGQAYRGMADMLLGPYKLQSPRIGAIGYNGGNWKVTKRPLTFNMNEIVRVGNFPPKRFVEGSFQNASEYFQELANHQFLHLKHQRNNAFKDEHDCRKKYIARCLFLKITREIRTEKGPFRLYCDDFRPSNVLVASESDVPIKAIIDWEFTYIAPVEFFHAAPW